MDASRRKKVVLRWTLFITSLVAIYRVWSWRVTGDFEPFTVWRFDVNEAHELGFAVSPLWDLPVAAVMTFLLALIVTSPQMSDTTDRKGNVRAGAGFLAISAVGSSAFFGLLWAINNGLTVGMGLGFIATFGIVFFVLAPLFISFLLLQRLVLSTPLRALGRWLMAR